VKEKTMNARETADIFEKIEKTLLGSRPTDDIATEDLREISYDGKWILAEEDIFRSWTGLRRINGEDHHGPVQYMEGGLYRGSRVCGCKTCQEHVEPRLRKN
jgi:hypothetical protein